MAAKMCRKDRAKQFMPFAALKGYPEALRKKEKMIASRAELSEDYQEELDRKLQQICKNDIISVVYFNENEYLTTTGMVSEIDKELRRIKIVNKNISFGNIYDIIL